MESRGLSNDSSEAKLLGRKLLQSLTEAYGRMIFGTGERGRAGGGGCLGLLMGPSH